MRCLPCGGPRRGRQSSYGRLSHSSTRQDTAVEMLFPMWLMPVHSFIALRRLEAHEDVRDRLVEWNESMSSVFFVSHQWTSFEHPDPSREQLRTLQTVLRRMMRREVPTTEPEFSEALYLAPGVKIKSDRWAEVVADAYVWFDYFSVPQRSEEEARTPGGTVHNAMTRAVSSIPAYVERCSHFFVLAPPTTHEDTGATCDYGAWLGRGWCNLELVALLLARFARMPAIVIKGPDCAPFMIGGGVALTHPPGRGAFTCCQRGHERVDGATGATVRTRCDKAAIAPVIVTMLRHRMAYHLGRGEVDQFRSWRALVPHFMQGLPRDAANAPPEPRSVEAFLRAFRFRGPTDGERASGLSPLLIAAATGNVDVARALLADSGADVSATTREPKDSRFSTPPGRDSGRRAGSPSRRRRRGAAPVAAPRAAGGGPPPGAVASGGSPRRAGP